MVLLVLPCGDALLVFDDGRAVRLYPDGATAPPDALERLMSADHAAQVAARRLH
jgi:hypothetical protein